MRIAWFRDLERHFCHEKSPSKEKVPCRLRGPCCSCTAIFDYENGSLSLKKRHFGDSIALNLNPMAWSDPTSFKKDPTPN